MPTKGTGMKKRLNNAINAAIVHGMVMGNWAIFELVRHGEPRFQKSLEDFEAVYQFRAGKSGRRLIFAKGRIKNRSGVCDLPDYELVLIDPPGVLKGLVKNPDDMIRLLMENRIDQRGNNYYLFKYGYLLGLCDDYVRGLIENMTPRFFRTGKIHGY